MPASDLSNPVVPEFDIIVNGRTWKDTLRPVIGSILVDDSIAWPSMFALQLTGCLDFDEVQMWMDSDLAVGAVVEIKLGYGDEVKSLIIGEITGLEPEFVIDRPANLIVRGYDRRYRLQKGRKTRTFVGKKDSDIASQIASEANLGVDGIGDSKVIHDYVIQANQTDLEFLRERATRIQYEVFVTNKTLHFRPVQNEQSEVLTLVHGDHLLEFYPRLSITQQVAEVSVRGWDPQEKREIISTAETGFGSAQMDGAKSGPQINKETGATMEVLSMLPTMTQAEADQIAKAALNQKALTLIEGEGTCLGDTDLRAGTVIKIAGVGQRFGGKYYVTAAVHNYSAQGGYRTQFQVRRNAS